MSTKASEIEETFEDTNDFIGNLVSQDTSAQTDLNSGDNDPDEDDDDADDDSGTQIADDSATSQSSQQTAPANKSVEEILDVFTEHLFIPAEGVDVTNKEEVSKLLDYHNTTVIDTFIDQTKENLSEKEVMLLEALTSGIPLSEIDFDFQAVDYSQVDETDEENQRNLLFDYYVNVNNMDEEDVEILISSLNPETLASRARVAKEKLSDFQLLEIQNAKELHERRLEEQEIIERQQLADFKSKILSIDSVAGMNLSNEDKLAIYDYYTLPVKNGKTQNELDQTSIDNVALRAIMNIKNISLDKLSRQAETKVVNRLLRVGSSEQNTGGRTVQGKSGIATTQNTTFAYDL
jgi:hypothetical protein